MLILFPATQLLAGDGERDTYIFMDEPLAPYTIGQIGETCEGGVNKMLLDELFGRLGIEYELHLVPWARALKSAQFGRADGIPLLMKSEEREAYLLYSDPVLENRELFYYLKDAHPGFSWNAFSDLKGMVIGLVNGYTYGEVFLKALEVHDFQVHYSENTTANFLKLLAGRVDLTLEDESMARTQLAQHPDWAARITQADKPVSSYYWYMGISRLSPLADMIHDINRTLADMREDGSLDSILDIH